TEPGSIKVTPLEQFPAKGRATGGVRCHKFRSGEDRIVLAWAGTGPARAATASGVPIPLPDPDSRRDGTGSPGTAPVGAIAGAL
ncbi:MAG: DNA gyrase C-terminal beta-propeller domain-containing protein, partial [Actinomycetota bacterium]|nr:DNA gyrase C-terminal beta-propeller domain-containing protein [Actinomycetota bacterium]